MDWRLNVARQAVLSRLPFGGALRRFKRRYFGYEPDRENLLGTLASLERIEAALGAVGRSFVGATVLEIGTGWFPTIPIMLALRGASRILMTDLQPHMDEVTFAATLHFLKGELPGERQLAAIRSIDDLPLSYLAPFDPAALADGSIDIVCSRTVLEHIPPPDIVDLLRRLRPKLAPEGLMIHLIDHSDHLEHADKSISKINFLTWSDRKHAIINRLTRNGENRLRHHEYDRLFNAAGYRVLDSQAEVHHATRAMVRSLSLAAPYSAMSPDEVSILMSLVVLAPADAYAPGA